MIPKNESLQNKENRYFHVTPISNLSSVLQSGLIPQIGDRSELIGETDEAIYLFSSFEDLNNALYNWLGEYFENLEEDLVILQIDLPEAFPIRKEADSFETICYLPIPKEYITNIYDEYYKKLNKQDINSFFSMDEFQNHER